MIKSMTKGRVIVVEL